MWDPTVVGCIRKVAKQDRSSQAITQFLGWFCLNPLPSVPALAPLDDALLPISQQKAALASQLCLLSVLSQQPRSKPGQLPPLPTR